MDTGRNKKVASFGVDNNSEIYEMRSRTKPIIERERISKEFVNMRLTGGNIIQDVISEEEEEHQGEDKSSSLHTTSHNVALVTSMKWAEKNYVSANDIFV